jgi:polyhydroxyalkanoate synthesis regulator phasin
MRRARTRTIAIGAAAALAVAGGGAALAATQLGDPKAESQKIVTDAAKELGVTPSALTNAIEKAMQARVDAAVTAGQLTKEQGDALKARIASGELPLFAGPGGGFRGHHEGFGHHGGFRALDGAAAYLGITVDALRTELAGGKSLADVAKAKGKSVDGLVSALVAAETKEIDDAVTAGRLTKEQATSVKANLKARITDLVNGKAPEGFGPGFGPRRGHPWGDGDGGGRPAFVPASQGGSTF